MQPVEAVRASQSFKPDYKNEKRLRAAVFLSPSHPPPCCEGSVDVKSCFNSTVSCSAVFYFSGRRMDGIDQEVKECSDGEGGGSGSLGVCSHTQGSCSGSQTGGNNLSTSLLSPTPPLPCWFLSLLLALSKNNLYILLPEQYLFLVLFFRNKGIEFLY